MVRTLQIKFVKTAMTAITVLLLVVICAISGIYSFNLYSQSKSTAEMLANNGGIPDFEKMKQYKKEGTGATEDWASEGWVEGEMPPQGQGQEGFEPGPPEQEREDISGQPQQGENGGTAGNMFFMGKMSPDDVMSVRYFIVNFDSEGGVESVDTGSIYSVSDEEAEEYGAEVIAKGNRSGITGNFMYYVGETDSGKIAAFVDISSRLSSVISVVVTSLSIAAIAWILMFIFVRALSRKAITPIAENIVKQKQFVTNAGHELNTPLAIIMANTEALELFNGETKWTRNIKAQTRRLNVLMQNLLTLSKMDEADLNLPMQEFDLGELIRESALPFEEPAHEKKQRFHVESPAITVKANRDTMGQLIGILLDNAVKYTPEGGEISMTAFSEGGSVILRQQNSVNPEDIEENPERLFDRFYRRDEARTQKKGGYGIGLSAARAIASANHAEISVGYVEQNIVFTVKLMI